MVHAALAAAPGWPCGAPSATGLRCTAAPYLKSSICPADAGIQPDGEWRRREVPLSVAPAAAGAAAPGQGPAAQPAAAAARDGAAHDAAGCDPGGGGLAELCRVLQREERAALRAALAEAADACAPRCYFIEGGGMSAGGPG